MKREGGKMNFVTGEIDFEDHTNANTGPSPKKNNVVYQSKVFKGTGHKDQNANKSVPALVLDEEDFSADL